MSSSWFVEGPCDGAFGQQVNKVKSLDLICVDQLAMHISEIKNQEAFIVNPARLFCADDVFRLYVLLLPLDIFSTPLLMVE